VPCDQPRRSRRSTSRDRRGWPKAADRAPPTNMVREERGFVPRGRCPRLAWGVIGAKDLNARSPARRRVGRRSPRLEGGTWGGPCHRWISGFGTRRRGGCRPETRLSGVKMTWNREGARQSFSKTVRDPTIIVLSTRTEERSSVHGTICVEETLAFLRPHEADRPSRTCLTSSPMGRAIAEEAFRTCRTSTDPTGGSSQREGQGEPGEVRS